MSAKSKAVFERLTGDIIGVIRVYHGDDVVEPAPYKFFTVVVIDDDVAKIVGMKDSDVNFADLKAIARELSSLNVDGLMWTHKGKQKIYRVKKTIDTLESK